MKIIAVLLPVLAFISCAGGKERKFTGSTPDGEVVRTFLGIPRSDSIDFIRWNLTLDNNSYQLDCHYGIGKPNTNGFMNSGKKLSLSGELKKENNFYRLQNGNKILQLAELNEELLQILDDENRMLAGNGGWSYTLNNINPASTDQLNFVAKEFNLKDSAVFIGRTPCNIPGLIPKGEKCYKLKWSLVFYPGQPGYYKVKGTPWRESGGKTGTWQMVNGINGRLIYQLNNENGKGFLYLLNPDENILVFTDDRGKLLVGDEDFSYTLNRE